MPSPEFLDDALTRNAFLGGALQIWQPKRGYRAGIDPVLLAAAVPAKAGQTVLELGTGAGTAALCLMRRVPGLLVTGVEVQPGYAALARRNAAENTLPLTIVTADISDLPPALRQQSFDHVMANPPFFAQDAGTGALDAGRAAGRARSGGMLQWAEVAAGRLRPGGTASFVLRVENLAEILAAMDRAFGAIVVQPIAPRHGRAAKLVLIQGIKGRRTGLQLAAPIILHEGPAHLADGDDYTPEISAVLRDGQALTLRI